MPLSDGQLTRINATENGQSASAGIIIPAGSKTLTIASTLTADIVLTEHEPFHCEINGDAFGRVSFSAIIYFSHYILSINLNAIVIVYFVFFFLHKINSLRCTSIITVPSSMLTEPPSEIAAIW